MHLTFKETSLKIQIIGIFIPREIIFKNLLLMLETVDGILKPLSMLEFKQMKHLKNGYKEKLNLLKIANKNFLLALVF